MPAVLGCDGGSGLAAIEKDLGAKVPCARVYCTMDNPTPADWQQLTVDRELFTSEKFKLGGQIFPVQEILDHKHDAAIDAYGDYVVVLGHEDACIDHESDAKTAGGGGNYAQIQSAILYAMDRLRKRPGWNARIFLCLTGYLISQRGPAFAQAIAAADGMMIDPYSDGVASMDSVAGPEVDWIVKNFLGKPIVIGEWGAPPGASQAKIITDFATALATMPRYASVEKAMYWNAGGFALDTNGRAALVAAIKASATVPPDQQIAQLKQQLAAANQQLVTVSQQLTTAQQLNTAQAAQIAMLAADNAHLHTAAQTAVSTLNTAMGSV